MCFVCFFALCTHINTYFSIFAQILEQRKLGKDTASFAFFLLNTCWFGTEWSNKNEDSEEWGKKLLSTLFTIEFNNFFVISSAIFFLFPFWFVCHSFEWFHNSITLRAQFVFRPKAVVKLIVVQLLKPNSLTFYLQHINQNALDESNHSPSSLCIEAQNGI